ncbi:OST-HTH/LOTUS domain-containing protein [Pseudomonas sp. CR3202]|uniref:OST-HTH/LOTUS domain-containing protein n=1 Tax=Pseudomonas sp. CR3202 TaxID=3351532 RepID=UPI003BF188D5
MTAMEDRSLEELRSAIAERMGRCVLVLQQYEILLKRLLAHHEYAGPVDALAGYRANREEHFSDQTLGQLVKQFTKRVLRPSTDNMDEFSIDGSPQETLDSFVQIRQSIGVAEEHHEALCSDLQSLVDLRNRLVHHFLEEFPDHDSEGCHAAIRFLDEALDKVRRKHQQLTNWAKSFDQARRDLVDLMQTPGLDDFVKYGIVAGQETNWPNTTIVSALREVERHLGVDGWTNLEMAIGLIRSYPLELTPKKYECSSWRQVLHESKLFLTERRPAASGVGRETWYRSKAAN